MQTLIVIFTWAEQAGESMQERNIFFISFTYLTYNIP
jgi:hypothetical protein